MHHSKVRNMKEMKMKNTLVCKFTWTLNNPPSPRLPLRTLALTCVFVRLGIMNSTYVLRCWQRAHNRMSALIPAIIGDLAIMKLVLLAS